MTTVFTLVTPCAKEKGKMDFKYGLDGWIGGLLCWGGYQHHIKSSKKKANGFSLECVGLGVLSSEQPVKKRYIIVKYHPSLYFSMPSIINKGVPRVIEARA